MKKALVFLFAVMIAFVFAGTGFAQAPAAAPADQKPAAAEKTEKKVEKKAKKMKKMKKAKKEKKEEKKEEAAAPAPAK